MSSLIIWDCNVSRVSVFGTVCNMSRVSVFGTVCSVSSVSVFGTVGGVSGVSLLGTVVCTCRCLIHGALCNFLSNITRRGWGGEKETGGGGGRDGLKQHMGGWERERERGI